MFILEAPYGQRTGFVSLYDFFFFAVVTISTVGYGDFAPTKPASKAIVIVAIVVALTVLPTQIQKLLSAVQTPLTVVGRLPSDKQDYIVISGPIDPQQLALICRELALAFPGCCSRVLVITPDAVVDYVDAIRDAFLRDAMRISAIRLDFVSLKARTYYRNARAVFIVGNMRPKESNALQKFSLKDSEATLLEEDHNALLRFIGAQHVCWPARPICIQLSDGATTRLVTEMGAYHVLCVQHIKMKLLGKACSGCPGFSTLMTNLFYTPPKEADLLVNNLHTGRLKVSDETRNLRLYYRGARYQLYRLEFPQCCIGIQFSLLVRILAARYKIYLLGMACVTKKYWMNPIGYRIGDEADGSTIYPFAGVVAAPSLAVVQKVANLQHLTYDPKRASVENYLIRQSQRDRLACVEAYYDTLSKTNVEPPSSRANMNGPGRAGESSPTTINKSWSYCYFEKRMASKNKEARIDPSSDFSVDKVASSSSQPFPSDIREREKGRPFVLANCSRKERSYNENTKESPTAPKSRTSEQRRAVCPITQYAVRDASILNPMESCEKTSLLWPPSIPSKLTDEGQVPAVAGDVALNAPTVSSAYGIPVVQSAEMAFKTVFKKIPNKGLIVICGWPRGLTVFLSAVHRSLETNFIILAPHLPSGLSSDALAPFVQFCAWVKGSPLDVGDLLRAGVLQARSCVVFSAPHVPWRETLKPKRTDSQAVLVREFLFALRQCDEHSTSGSRLGIQQHPSQIHHSPAFLNVWGKLGGMSNSDGSFRGCHPALEHDDVSHEVGADDASDEVSIQPIARETPKYASFSRRVPFFEATSPSSPVGRWSASASPAPWVSPNRENTGQHEHMKIEHKRPRHRSRAPPGNADIPARSEISERNLSDEEGEAAFDLHSVSPETVQPYIVTELRRNSFLGFLNADATLPSADYVFQPNQSEWETQLRQECLCLVSPEYTSGSVLLEELLHGMIAYCLPVSRFCMDSHIIDHFVEGTHTPLPPGINPTCPLWLESVPLSHAASSFGDLLDYYLREKQKLPFSIYRCFQKSRKKRPLDLFRGGDNTQHIVITCPPLDTLLQPGDQIYVINACPSAALGLLFAHRS